MSNSVKSKLLANGAWLTLLQAFNTIVPLLTIPYVTRVLGVVEYGKFSVALNLVYYIQVIVEYGFSMSGARKVALSKSQDDLNNTYTSILFSRILLTLISGLILIVFILFANYDTKTVISIWILFIIVAGTTIQLTWLFQGKQDMRSITMISVFARLLSLLLIFIFVKDTSDLFIYCLLYASTNIIYGITCQIIGWKKYSLKLIHLHFSALIDELKDGWYLFTSSAMSKIFGNIGVTILGIVATDYYVGIYSAISKITTVLILAFLPISQTIFPHLIKLFSEDYNKGITFVKKVAFSTVPIFIILSAIVFALRVQIINMAFGNDYSGFELLLAPLLLWMVFSIINNFLGIQVLVASGRQQAYSRAFFISIIFLIIYNITLVKLFLVYGVAWAQAASEFTLTTILLLTIFKDSKSQKLMKGE